jgi:tRNA(Ile2) C34 agmatinyltransferase TiaS
MTTYFCPRCVEETSHKAAGESDLRCVPCGLRHDVTYTPCQHEWETDGTGVTSCLICRRVP